MTTAAEWGLRTMTDIECPTCGAVSDIVWKCSECGKPFDGDEPTGGDRAVLGGGS